MKRIVALLALLSAFTLAGAKGYTLSSPDGHITITIQAGANLTYTLSRDNVVLVNPSEISLTLADGSVWGPGSRFSKAVRATVDKTEAAPVFKRSEVRNHCNELTLKAKGFSLVFRAYNDGMAWRFVPEKAVTVKEELVSFAFPEDWYAYIPYVNQNTKTLQTQLMSSHEAHYTHAKVSEWNTERLAFLPITVEAADGIKLCIMESDLLDYPGMYLYNGEGGSTLKGVFAPVPATHAEEDGRTFQQVVTSFKDVIAQDTEIIPWRIIEVAPEDKQLTASDFSWRLASAQAPGDFSWVKPGKVAWDWWNGWNLYGVDFEAGINNPTYKYYIDFASAFGIEYIVLDEGWAKNTVLDIMHTRPEIDLPELVNYGKERGVGLILWTTARTFDAVMEEACEFYSKMGIKGWKIDFMDRDDQEMIRFYTRAGRVCAKYQMLADFHGACKPAGLQKVYPNVINFEGVYGLENMKWGDPSVDQVTYDVTIPFTRLVAGPADYTQGAMRNANRENYRSVGTEGMSQGTRCHQLAEYVIFDAPLSMLCDSPSNYWREKECVEFIAACPTIWDETVALDGKIGEYVVQARRKGDVWYVAALNNWEARDICIDLSFLGDGHAVVFQDGINAHRAARDYAKKEIGLEGGCLKVHLAPGGGWVLKK